MNNTSAVQNTGRVILGTLMLLAGIGHLTFARTAFQAQVPDWVPLSKDLTVLASGLVELGFALALLFWKSRRPAIGVALAIFYILVFPGNISQYTHHRDAFGLNTDTRRLVRLFFQPILVWWSVWCTGVLAKRNRSQYLL